MKRRVLFWCHSFLPTIGGVELFAARLLPALRSRGYEITVLTAEADRVEASMNELEGVPIYRVPFHRAQTYGLDEATTAGKQKLNLEQNFVKPLFEVRARVIEILKAVSPDLVHLNSVYSDGFFYLTTVMFAPAPLLFSLHGDWPISSTSIVERNLTSAAWVTAPSAGVLAKATQLVNKIAERSSVVVHGAAPPVVAPSPLPIDPPRIVCVGRLSPEKGFDVAVKAFARVVHRFPRALLIIAGDGPERAALEKQVDELKLSDRVKMVGWVAPDNVSSLLNTATQVVIPSRSEGFGLVALQAALVARPVVATRVGGLPEVVVNGETGLVVESENSKALAEAMVFLLTHPKHAARVGQAAQMRASELFSWERHVDAYDALYQRLIRQKHSYAGDPDPLADSNRNA